MIIVRSAFQACDALFRPMRELPLELVERAVARQHLRDARVWLAALADRGEELAVLQLRLLDASRDPMTSRLKSREMRVTQGNIETSRNRTPRTPSSTPSHKRLDRLELAMTAPPAGTG